MSMSGDQSRLQRTQEQLEITVHAQPIEEVAQPQLAQPMQMQAAPVEQQREMEANAALAAQVQQQLPAAQAQVAAPGAPVQEEVPAKMSWKERRREKKHAQAAKKACPVGTAATYDMVKDLQRLADKKERSMQDHQGDTNGSGVDMRVLRTFSTGYRLDRKGRPATPEGAKAKQADDQFFADYCSKDVQRRAPHLDRMVNELVNMQYPPDMFSERNLRRNMARIKEMGDKMVYMENVMKDPVNKPFFDRLDPVRKEALEAGFKKMYTPFVGAMAMISQKYGVDFNSSRYYGYDAEPAIEQGQAAADAMHQDYLDAIGAYAQEKAAIDARQTVRVQEAAQSYALQFNGNSAALERVKADPRLGLRPEEVSSPYLTRTVMLVQAGEEHQEENLETVRTCLEMGRVGTSARPTPELYQKARDMLAPRVQRVLDCDVEHFAQMNDEALLVSAPQLNDLFMDNMFVADLMKLQHHNLSDPDGTPITLKDDLVGQRMAEYAYKLNMLRGLSERARALAILRQQEAGGGVDQTYFTSKEWSSSGAGADPAGWARKRMEVGANAIQVARETLHNQLTPGTPTYRQTLEQMKKQERRTSKILETGPLFGVAESMFLEDTQEKRDVMKRIHYSRYSSLAHSPEELRERGLPTDIGEPIFRGYAGFLSTEAAQKLLTPERFDQMLRDLGAGGDLDNAPPEARQEAIERNRQGLAEYKRVIRAQYDMLARKYGTSLPNMSLQEMLLHRQDIIRDFIDAQVPLNMATKYPDFLDENDPEDLLLKKRIEYYSFMGKAACDLAGDLSLLFTSEKDAQESKDRLWTLSARNETLEDTKQFLAEHDTHFTHGVDWKQAVRLPEENG